MVFWIWWVSFGWCLVSSCACLGLVIGWMFCFGCVGVVLLFIWLPLWFCGVDCGGGASWFAVLVLACGFGLFMMLVVLGF